VTAAWSPFREAQRLACARRIDLQRLTNIKFVIATSDNLHTVAALDVELSYAAACWAH